MLTERRHSLKWRRAKWLQAQSSCLRSGTGDNDRSTANRRIRCAAQAYGQRRPGTKEIRYAHLLSGDLEAWEPPSETHSAGADSADGERILHLEEQVAALQREVAELKQEVADFRKQFE